MKRSWPSAAGALIAITISSTPAAPSAFAQESQGAESVVCLARPLSDVPQVSQASRGQAFRILAVEAVVPTLEAKGFMRVECKNADLVLATKRNGYRDQICEAASFGNEAVQNQFERAMGERPAVLCAAAEAAVGPWIRRSSG